MGKCVVRRVGGYVGRSHWPIAIVLACYRRDDDHHEHAAPENLSADPQAPRHAARLDA
jgi:hypothetical protein